MTQSQKQHEQKLLRKLQHFDSQGSDVVSPSVMQTEHHFDSYYEYILSIVGFAVGFGSFWRFPYLIYKNGGGVFLIPYIFALVFVGTPLIYLQTAVGQMHQKSIPFIFARINKGLKGVGIIFILISLNVSGYYNLILTYSYRFIFSSFNNPLPFNAQNANQNSYFTNTILNKSTSISQFGEINPILFILYAFSLYICYLVIKDGVKTSGKVVMVTALAPYFFFCILFIRAMFLDGAGSGITYLFKPDWTRLFDGQIWVQAIVQVFFQTTVAIGGIVNLSSLKPKKQSFIEAVYLIPLSILVCGMLCALNIFMYLGHFALEQNLSIKDLKLSGPELSFNIFPKALTILPWPNFWVFFFFISMVFLGIDTMFAFFETICCYLKDQAAQSQIKILGIQVSLSNLKKMVPLSLMLMCPFLTSSAGIYYMQYFDTFVASVPLSAAALIQLYTFVYLVPFSQLDKQTSIYLKHKAPNLIKWLIESKLLLIVLIGNLAFALLHQVSYKLQQLLLVREYSFWFYVFGWLITSYPFIIAYFYWKNHKEDQFRLTFQQIKQRQNYL